MRALVDKGEWRVAVESDGLSGGDPLDDRVKLWIASRSIIGGAPMSVAEPMVFRSVEEGVALGGPVLALERGSAQALFLALLEAFEQLGLIKRLPDPGALEAKERHLQDMRTLVFRTLEEAEHGSGT